MDPLRFRHLTESGSGTPILFLGLGILSQRKVQRGGAAVGEFAGSASSVLSRRFDIDSIVLSDAEAEETFKSHRWTVRKNFALYVSSTLYTTPRQNNRCYEARVERRKGRELRR